MSRKAFVVPSLVLIVISVLGCSTLPGDKFIRHHFPKTKAFVDTEPTEPYKVLGVVRARANFNTADPNRDERMLCENYYNKAVKELVRRAKNEAGGDAVMRVRSVVFYMDGKTDLFPRPECSDDGAEGQVLVQGEAIRYTPKSSLISRPKKK